MAHTICFLCTFLLYVCHFQYFCSGTDTIRYGHWIDEGGAEEIVSAGNIFRLGFFTRGNASRRYVGIWYCDSPKVIVWVANREVPIPTNASGTFGIDVKGGNLEVSDRGDTSTYFSTNVTNSPTYLRIAKLFDDGNLVLFSSTPRGKKLWESFKQPTDTFLLGMKMDENLTLTSWRSEEDPAPGDFSFQLDEDIRGGYVIKKSGLEPYWKSGGESANSFIQKQMSFPADLLLSGTIDSDTSKVVNHSRLWMRPDGKIQYLSWEFDKKEWSLGWSEPEGPCNFYSVCGSYGSCKPDSRTQKIPVCTCLPGFEPNNEDDWKLGKFSGGCSKMPSKCTHDNTTSFFKMRVNTLQSNTPRFIPDSKESNCTLKCQNDCGCRATLIRIKIRIITRSWVQVKVGAGYGLMKSTLFRRDLLLVTISSSSVSTRLRLRI